MPACHHNASSRRARVAFIASFGVALALGGCKDSRDPMGMATGRGSPRAERTRGGSDRITNTNPVTVELFAPESGDHAGIGGIGWFIDIAIEYDNMTLAQTGFTGFQLTGPGAHNNVAPFPGTFS